jgi:phospholipid/cholesterol/gamma-HCH transport system ATP-binding protein
MISLQQISVHFGDRYVLDGLNLEVNKGDFIVVYGGAGSGKTTLLKTLLGLHTTYEGKVFIDHHDVRRMTKPERRYFLQRCGVVLQDEALLANRSVIDNLRLPGVTDSQVQVMLAFLQLAPFRDRTVSSLSIGERKLVDLGRSLIHDPPFIVWDSPFAQLDSISSKRLMNYLLELHKSGRTLFVTTSAEHVKEAFSTAANAISFQLLHGQLGSMSKAFQQDTLI